MPYPSSAGTGNRLCSSLYESEEAYARALIRYAREEGITLSVRVHGLAIVVRGKADAALLVELRSHDLAVIAELAKGGRSGSFLYATIAGVFEARSISRCNPLKCL